MTANVDERDPSTWTVIGAAIEVHREIGPGLLESVYQTCLEEELRLRNLEFIPQYRLPVIYKGKELDDEFVIDFYFPGRLILEIKSVERMMPVFDAQLLTYLKLSQTKLSLLANFNVPVMKDGIKRLVN